MSIQTVIGDLATQGTLSAGSFNRVSNTWKVDSVVSAVEIERLFYALADDQRERGNEREAYTLERIATMVPRHWVDDPCD